MQYIVPFTLRLVSAYRVINPNTAHEHIQLAIRIWGHLESFRNTEQSKTENTRLYLIVFVRDAAIETEQRFPIY